MLIDLDGMAVFAYIVDTGGVTAAARALKLPKSNVSRRLANLESRLGVRLLERTTRTIHLTEIGEIYYRHCRRIVEEVEHAELSIANSVEIPRGTLRVSTSVVVGQQLIAPILSRFIPVYPDVRVSLQISNRRIDLIEEGYDLAIRVGQLEDSSLISRSLFQADMGIYGASDYLKSHPTIKVPVDLTQHDCLVMSHEESRQIWNLTGPAGTEHVEIYPKAMVNDFAVLQRLVLDGLGVALLPNYVARRSRLLRVLPEWSYPPVELHAIYPSRRGAMPKTRAFLDWLIHELDLQSLR